MPATNSAPWLELRRVSVRLGTRLFLRELDWAWRPGEQWAIVGPNGAGKTVLAHAVGARLRPSGGSIDFAPPLDPARDIAWVSFEEQQALADADARHDISEFMDSAVDPGTTVEAYLRAGAADGERLDAIVGRLGLGELRARGLRFLSSGEMRRTLLARALLASPRLVVLDNPYEGIDAGSRRAARALIEELVAGSTPVLFLTRNPAELPAAVTHVLALDGGRPLACGPRAAVLAQTRAADADDLAAALAEATLPEGIALAAPCPPEVPLIELAGVRAWYGEHTVLDGVDLRLEHGEHLCIAGPNGCGKSTLLALVCGDNPRAYGQQVRVFGRLRGDGESVWELKRRFGIVGNSLHLAYPRRSSAFDCVASGFFDSLGLYEDCSARQREIAGRWLDLLGLASRASARFDALSFGEQRMMLIARAMVKSPPLLILDEPCSGLDPRHRRQVLALIDRIAATTDTQVLYVSHEASELPACITRVLEFRRGGNGRYTLESTTRPHTGSDAGS